MKATKHHTGNLTKTGLFLAMGIVLPFLFGQIPEIGSMLLPMHIPVFLCAFLCGWQYAVPMAVTLPLLRSFLFQRPNFYPEALSIAVEMAVYALVAGLCYRKLCERRQADPKRSHSPIKAAYLSMIPAMLLGRIARVGVQLALLGIAQLPFTFRTLCVGIVVLGIPGILLQLIVVPPTVALLHRTQAMPIPEKES